ncbi:MAG: hypothetical protein M3405_11470 [Acidobacteriota bacterium]|jgi:hypothetical protein|nr:hypothetical protein [Acidobacteriota bacterium]
MQTEIADTIYKKVKTLPLDKQEEILEFIEEKISSAEKKDTRPIWEVAKEISESVPLEEWEKLPSDGSINHDHYLYGSPKKYK